MRFESRLVTVETGPGLNFHFVVHPVPPDASIVSRAQIGWGWNPRGSSVPDTFPERIRLSPMLTPKDLRELGNTILKIASEMEADFTRKCKP